MKVKRILGYKLGIYKEILGEFYEPLLQYEVVDLPDEIVEKVAGVREIEARGRKKKEEIQNSQDTVVENDEDNVIEKKKLAC